MPKTANATAYAGDLSENELHFLLSYRVLDDREKARVAARIAELTRPRGENE